VFVGLQDSEASKDEERGPWPALVRSQREA